MSSFLRCDAARAMPQYRMPKLIRVVTLVGCAVVANLFFGGDTFIGFGQRSTLPGGRFLLKDSHPEGVICRPAYGSFVPDTYVVPNQAKYGKSSREGYLQFPDWKGEPTWEKTEGSQTDNLRQWYHFDCDGKCLADLGRRIVSLLMGTDSPLQGIDTDMGAFVVVTNCELVRVTDQNYHHKLYIRNERQHPGGTRVERFKDILARFPERILMREVWEHMPKNPDTRRIFKDRLKLFSGPNHLYYHKEPVEYPMYIVKDITMEDNIPKAIRHVEFITKTLPVIEQRAVEQQQMIAEQRKEQYKDYLREQLQKDLESGDTSVEKMGLDAFEKKADGDRIARTLRKWEGKRTPLEKPPNYLGTKFPIQNLNLGKAKIGAVPTFIAEPTDPAILRGGPEKRKKIFTD